MQNLLERPDARMLLTGAGVAVAAGVLIGVAMKPDFGDDRTLGPQYFSADGGLHQVSYRPDPGVSVYGGKIPDYVIGTDWTRPRREVAYAPRAADTADAAEPAVYTAQDQEEGPPAPLMVTHTTWRDEPPPASSYPSLDGDRRYRSEAREESPVIYGRDREPYGDAGEDQPD